MKGWWDDRARVGQLSVELDPRREVYCALMLSLIFRVIDAINSKLSFIEQLHERKGSQ
jgi:hypothetical protein